MSTIPDFIRPSKNSFESDPFGYAAIGWHRWGVIQNLAGFPVDIEKGPVSNDLKSPVLWLLHAYAMTEAALLLVKGTPNFDTIPEELQGICHCQYHAVALMLVGYSLETCLKAILIIKKGITTYQAEEKQHYHHCLVRLADFIPDLNEKEKSILSLLSHFVRWAGRYPDPGFDKINQHKDIFSISEKYQISAKDLFALADRIMKYSSEICDSAP